MLTMFLKHYSKFDINNIKSVLKIVFHIVVAKIRKVRTKLSLYKYINKYEELFLSK